MSKITVISNVLVAFIVNSFQRLDEVEEYVRQVESKDLFTYKCTISKAEVLLVMSFVLLIGSIQATEYLVGKPIEAIYDLHSPGDFVDDIDGFSGATIRANKILSAIKDGLNRGIY